MVIYVMGGAGTLLVVFEAYLWVSGSQRGKSSSPPTVLMRYVVRTAQNKLGQQVGVTLAIINAAQTVISEMQVSGLARH